MSLAKWSHRGHFELLLHLSLLYLILFSGDHWFTRVPLTALSVSGFIWRDLIYRRMFWFVAFCFMSFEIGLHWFESDNHKYLATYWFLSLSMIVPLTSDQEKIQKIALHGRSYLALSMGLAVLWKLINSDFTSAAFFEYTLLVDDRFKYFTHLITGLPLADLLANQTKEAQFIQIHQETIALTTNESLDLLAKFLTYFTLVIESSIAIGFLLFPKWHLSHLALIGFILATYPVASVIGFAWLLILFALSQCTNEKWSGYVTVYCILFVVTQSFRIQSGALYSLFW